MLLYVLPCYTDISINVSFHVNKPKVNFTFSIVYQNTLCESLRSNKADESIFFLINLFSRPFSLSQYSFLFSCVSAQFLSVVSLKDTGCNTTTNSAEYYLKKLQLFRDGE